MSLIDAHVHFLPPEMRAKLPTLREEEPYWGLLLDPPSGQSIQGYSSAEKMIADMDAAGVERAVIVGEYFQQPESCRRSNNQSGELLNRYPNRLLPLVAIQPLERDQALDELKRGFDAGFKGVGELNPYAQGFDLESAEFDAVVAFCIDAGWPINLHVNEEVGPYYNGKSAVPLRTFVDLAVRYPEATFILAHWGGGLFFYEMMPAVRAQLKNVFYDTAATPLQYPVKTIFEVALACCGPQKILFGSDYPLRLYPKSQKEGNMEPFLTAVDAVNLDEAVKKMIFHENALRCFGLQENQSGRSEMPPPPQRDLSGKIFLQTPIALILKNDPGAVELLRRHGIKTDDPVFSWEPLMQAAAAAGLGPSRWPALLEALNERLNKESIPIKK